MEIVIVLIFVVGYILIALEHPIKINKTATALVTGVLCWTLFAVSEPQASLLESSQYREFEETYATAPVNGEHGSHLMHYISHSLGHHLNDIAQILFFLMGAMTIVELIDHVDNGHVDTTAARVALRPGRSRTRMPSPRRVRSGRAW